MKKSHCLFSNLKNKFLLALAVIAMAFAFTGCPNPTVPGAQGGDNGSQTIPLVSAVNAELGDIAGTWENNDYGHSEYRITSSTITDAMMNCSYNIVSPSTVTSADGYTLIFTQCAQGTEWTPAGNYYVIAAKLNSNGSLDISCPLDYSVNYTSLSALQEVYTSSYGVEANRNWTTTCTAVGGGTPTSVTVFDGSGYMTKAEFASGNLTFSMMGNSGLDEYDSFIPTRDTSKEIGNIVLYLYNASERQIYGADLNYCAVKNVNGTKYVYWYIYDDEEDENDYMVESIYPDYMPLVSDDNLTALQQMYQ